MKLSNLFTKSVLGWCLIGTGFVGAVVPSFANEPNAFWNLSEEVPAEGRVAFSDREYRLIERVSAIAMNAYDRRAALPASDDVLAARGQVQEFLNLLPRVEGVCRALYQAVANAPEVQVVKSRFRREATPAVEAFASEVHRRFQEVALEVERPRFSESERRDEPRLRAQSFQMSKRIVSEVFEQFSEHLQLPYVSEAISYFSDFERVLSPQQSHGSWPVRLGGLHEFGSRLGNELNWIAVRLFLKFEYLGESWTITSHGIEREAIPMDVSMAIVSSLMIDRLRYPTAVDNANLCGSVIESSKVIATAPGQVDSVWRRYQEVGESIASVRPTVEYDDSLLERLHPRVSEATDPNN